MGQLNDMITLSWVYNKDRRDSSIEEVVINRRDIVRIKPGIIFTMVTVARWNWSETMWVKETIADITKIIAEKENTE